MEKVEDKDVFDDQPFYELMQQYRHASFNVQSYVVECFEDVKTFVRTAIAAERERWVARSVEREHEMNITITVLGEPIPKLRARHRASRSKTGKTVVRTYTPEKTVDYENRVRGAAFVVMNQTNAQIITGPCRLEAEFCFEVPASWPAWKKQEALTNAICHTTKPDIDNLIKSICDGLNGIVFVDDAQVRSITAIKRYGESAYTKIWIVESGIAGSQIKNKSELEEK